MPGPLAGIRVVDFSAVISGPLAAMMLADQGADVIKVEPPGRGDLLRYEWYRRGGLTSMFANVNRGKRSIVLDLQQDKGLEIALDLVGRADVLVENFRPGVMQRLGLGADAMLEHNPDLIYCSISGYGETGPYSTRRAYDPVLQGMSGHVAIQKNPEVPIPRLGSPRIDRQSGFVHNRPSHHRRTLCARAWSRVVRRFQFRCSMLVSLSSFPMG